MIAIRPILMLGFTVFRMAAWYPWVDLCTLAWAIVFVFVGAVAFEVIVVESPHKRLDIVIMQRIEQALMARVRTYLPVVVILLFVSGFMPSDVRCDGFACAGSRSGNWLLLKVVRAFGVLDVFVNAIWAMRHGKMDVCRFKFAHRVVLTLMVGIVFLAKAMFYL